MKMPSASASAFTRAPSVHRPRSTFNLSHRHLSTHTASTLFPIFCQLAYPGDTFDVDLTTFVRLNPTIAPIMDNITMDIHFFFVPHRLVWDNFTKFMGEQIDPGDSTDFLIPQVVAPAVSGFAPLSYFDNFGIDVGVPDISVSALPFRAMNLIFNQWYRDQDLQDSAPINRDDGPDPVADYSSFLRRNKPHDYFSSARPLPQKGPAVPIPLTGTIPLDAATARIATNASIGGADALGIYNVGAAADKAMLASGTYVQATNVAPSTGANLFADLAGIGAEITTETLGTINDLYEAEALQRLFLLDSRGGTRYPEVVFSHFGVVSPDARLQIPEYLGGGSAPINVSPVVQTSESATTPQGTLAGMGTSSRSGIGFSKSFTEHGYVIGLVSYRGDLTYQRGIDRHWSYLTKHDMFWPALQNISEQAILNKEIYSQGTADDDLVFGYIPRYSEMQRAPSRVTCEFRSDFTSSLDYWHLSQDFTALPLLNGTFVQDATPLTRALAVPVAPPFLFDSWFNFKATRPMSAQSIPSFTGRF